MVSIPYVGFIPAMFHDTYHWTIAPRSSSNASTTWSSSWRLRSRQPRRRGRRRWTTNATTRRLSLGRGEVMPPGGSRSVPLGPVGGLEISMGWNIHDIGDPPVKHGKSPIELKWIFHDFSHPKLHLEGILNCHVWSLEGYFGSWARNKGTSVFCKPKAARKRVEVTETFSIWTMKIQFCCGNPAWLQHDLPSQMSFASCLGDLSAPKNDQWGEPTKITSFQIGAFPHFSQIPCSPSRHCTFSENLPETPKLSNSLDKLGGIKVQKPWCPFRKNPWFHHLVGSFSLGNHGILRRVFTG